MSVDSLLKEKPDIWRQSVLNELGRLAQGVRNIKGNNVIEFIYKQIKFFLGFNVNNLSKLFFKRNFVLIDANPVISTLRQLRFLRHFKI